MAIADMVPGSTATDATAVHDRYGAAGLPRGLRINRHTGVISGTPSPATATANSTTVTVTVTDVVGNPPADVSITFPAVAKGDQILAGFAYTPATVTFGDSPPRLIIPPGALGALSYSATPADVCTVDETSGALTLAGAGECVVTATAAETAEYDETTATTTVTVLKQVLTGFGYRPDTVTFGNPAPMLTRPHRGAGPPVVRGDARDGVHGRRDERRVDVGRGGRLRRHRHPQRGERHHHRHRAEG